MDEVIELPIDRIKRGQYQPRQVFTQEELNELADSIEESGVIQPIVVRPIKAKDADYEILAGERRWRACQILVLDKIPSIIRIVSDEQAIKISLIENIQRKELNAIEEAEGLDRLAREFDLTHEEVAKQIGKSREYVTNAMRLLRLDPSVKDYIHLGKLDGGHGKILAGLDPNLQKMLGREAALSGLTQEQLTQRVKVWGGQKKARQGVRQDADGDRLLREWTKYIGARSEVKCDKQGRGFLKIQFASLDELQGIFQRAGFKPEEGVDLEEFCDDIVVLEKQDRNT